jgi:amino acid transporter
MTEEPLNSNTERDRGVIGLAHAVSIGVGGMIGAGIFSILGVAADLAGSATFVSFGLAGVLALFCAYSFGQLGARFPSAGGPVVFLIKGLGDNNWTGGLNLMLWLGYVLALALYARAFGGYAATFLPAGWTEVAVPVLAVGITGAFMLLNVAGAEAVGKAELAIVAVKVAILLGFVGTSAHFVEPARIAPSSWNGLQPIIFAGAIVFLSYEGFGLITNAAEDMRDASRDLPRALMLSVIITIALYVLVSLVAVGTLSPDEILHSKEFALAEAARPALGQIGFRVMAIAALFSTASAINATLYGGANVSYVIARRGSLPSIFQRRIWRQSRGGLMLTASLVALLAVLFDLEGIAMMGSAAFLIVYGGVNVAHLRLLDETGAAAWPVWIGLIGCGLVFVVLCMYIVSERRAAALGLVLLIAVSFGVTLIYRRFADP